MNPDKEERSSHPSYGVVRFSRRQGHPGRLFGSPLRDHGSYVTLTVGRADLIRDGFHDRTYSQALRGDLIEVDLSAAQFAELLTTMNVSEGVPCTISYLNGVRVERPPEILHETEKVQNTFKDKLRGLVSLVRSRSKEIREVLDSKKNLVQDDRRKITSLLDTIAMELESNLPYTLDVFAEAAEKVVTHAKAEVDAFVTANVVAAGLKALLNPQEPAPPALPAPEERKTE